MRLFTRTLLLMAFLALPVLMATSNVWAADSQQTTVYQDTEIDVYDGDDAEVSDPIEGWNRIMFQFNDILYFGLIRPISQVYGFIAPEFLRIGIRNFFHNLEDHTLIFLRLQIFHST